MEVIIIGAGTLSKLVIDILSFKKEFEIAGIYDDTYEKGAIVNGYAILGKTEDAFQSDMKNVIICIGNQKMKKEFHRKFVACNFSFPNVIAHNAIISHNSVIGKGCIIGFYTTILFDTTIGEGTCILNHVSINHNTKINAFGLIGVGVLIGNDCIIEEGVHIAMGQTILPSTKISAWDYIH
jgi:acetyltransferase-like isoleucine patch superfamily enzyme